MWWGGPVRNVKKKGNEKRKGERKGRGEGRRAGNVDKRTGVKESVKEKRTREGEGKVNIGRLRGTGRKE